MRWNSKIKNIQSITVGRRNQALPQDHEESVPKTHTQEIVMWHDDLFGWKSAPRFSISHLPLTHCGESPTLYTKRPKTKTSIHTLCFIFELSALELMLSAVAL